MDRRCCRPQLDTIAGGGHASCDEGRPQGDVLQPTPPSTDEPSALALFAILATALVVGAAVVAFSPEPKPRVESPASIHLCHSADLLMRCDDDF